MALLVLNQIFIFFALICQYFGVTNVNVALSLIKMQLSSENSLWLIGLKNLLLTLSTDSLQSLKSVQTHCIKMKQMLC